MENGGRAEAKRKRGLVHNFIIPSLRNHFQLHKKVGHLTEKTEKRFCLQPEPSFKTEGVVVARLDPATVALCWSAKKGLGARRKKKATYLSVGWTEKMISDETRHPQWAKKT